MLSLFRQGALTRLFRPMTPVGMARTFASEAPSATSASEAPAASAPPPGKFEESGPGQSARKLRGPPSINNAALWKRVLSVRRTVNMTRKGKAVSQSVLVVVGNGNGVGGYGEGKSIEYSKALALAEIHAIRNMQPIERYDSRTIYHDIAHKFKATNIHLRSRPPGFGLRANRYVHEICRCVGIRDLTGKVIGSRTPMNVVKATFEALGTQRLPEEIARGRGKRLVDVHHALYGARV